MFPHAAAVLAVAAALLAQPNAPPSPAGQDSRWTIALAGDIMLGRGVKRQIEQHDRGYPFAQTCSLTVRADLAIANLESPLTTAPYRTPSPWKFTGDTLDAARSLALAGFDYVSLANNHMADCGRDGFHHTMRWLDSAGVAHAGRTGCDTARFDSLRAADSLGARAYRDSLSCLPAYRTVKGIKVGFLSFCEPYLLAIARDYGGELVARADSATVARSVMAARDSCDLLVCSFHWGEEYRDHPTNIQRKLGRLAIDLGARIVHGHHPHVLQGVEFYRGGLIAYSLGNYVFDQRHERPRQSALLAIKMDGTALDSVALLPLEIVANRPQPAGKKGWRAITARMRKQCQRLGTAVEPAGSLLMVKPQAGKKKEPVK
jgi:poly-gamma-glutamate synthesis protein (capsule biosynthesis protein)